MANGHGGKRAGAGRAFGTATKKTRAIADAAAAQGLTPLEVTLATMRKAWARTNDGELVGSDLELALSCARDAMSFMHPRLQTISADVDAKLSGELVVRWGGDQSK